MTIFSPLNPVKYVPLNPTDVPQYTSRHDEDWRFADTLMPWEEQVCWNQPWLFQDTIVQQIISNVAPIRLRLFDLEGRVWYDDNFQQRQQIISMPGMFIYESRLALNFLTKTGVYFIRLDIGTDEGNAQISAVNFFISNNIENSETNEKTLLLEYKHRSYYEDMFFETGIAPSIRVPGRIKKKKGAARTTTWNDQNMRLKMVKRMPYTLFNMVIGSAEGVPKWFETDQLNYILGCSELKGDGRLYTINEGAEIEENAFDDDGYPLYGLSVEMRSTLNRGSRIVESGDSERGPISVVANTDSKGFGIDSGNSNYQLIEIV